MLPQRPQFTFLCILLWCCDLRAESHTYTWIGAAQNGLWADSRNWQSDAGDQYPGAGSEDVAIVQPPPSPGFDVYLNRPVVLNSLVIRQHGMVRSSGHSITLSGQHPLSIERFAQLRVNHPHDSLVINGNGDLLIDGAIVFDARETSLVLNSDIRLLGQGHVTSLDNTTELTIAGGTTLSLELDLIGSFSLAPNGPKAATLVNRGLVCARGFPGLITLGENLMLKDAPGGVRWMASGLGAELQFNRSADAASPHQPSLQGDFAVESWGSICLGPDVDIETEGALIGFQGSIVTDHGGRLKTAAQVFQGHMSSLSIDEPGMQAPKQSP